MADQNSNSDASREPAGKAAEPSPLASPAFGTDPSEAAQPDQGDAREVGAPPGQSAGAPTAARRGASANIPRRTPANSAWNRRPSGPETPGTTGASKTPSAMKPTAQTPPARGVGGEISSGEKQSARSRQTTTSTKKTTTTNETPSGPNGTSAPGAEVPRPRRGSIAATSAGGDPHGGSNPAPRRPGARGVAGVAGAALAGKAVAKATSAASAPAEQGKELAKTAVKNIAKGAATGGLAGAGRGILLTIWQSPLARTIAIGTILAIILAPVMLVLGVVLMSSMGSGSNPDNDVALSAAEAAGVSAKEAREAMAAVDGTDIPWTIYAAYKRATNKDLDVKAFQAALRNVDPSKRYRDIFAGAITGTKAGYDISKDKDLSALAQKVQDTYVSALVAIGVEKGQATSIYGQALQWSLGQGQQTCDAGGNTGTVPINQTGTPVYNLPPESSYGASLATLTPTQVNNARVIMSAVKLVFGSVPDQLQQRAAVIALVTAMQEAKFENLPTASSDLDSAGMFQQRPHYGSEADRMRADLSSYWFLVRLAGVPDWSTGSAASVAQTVQVSKYPDAYAKWETPIAQPLVKQYWSSVSAMPLPAGQTPPPGITVPGGGAPSAPCSAGNAGLAPGDPGNVGGGGGFMPNQAQVESAIAFASKQLGKPYVSPGDSVNTWDCSGLTLASYASAGVNLNGHLVSIQYNLMKAQGRLQPLADARRGDLVFWSSNGRDDAEFIHVAIYLGKDSTGKAKILAAPTEGDVVKIQDLWTTGGTVLMNMVGRPTGLP